MAERVLRLSFYPWITQGVPIEEITRQIRLFADVLAEQLTGLAGNTTYRVRVIDPQDVPVQVAQVANGDCEIALMNPLGYVFANRRNAQRVKAVAIALRETDGKVGPTYFAQIYTLKKTGIRDVRSARGRSLGFGAPFSTSNFLIPAYMLHKLGMHPFARFSRVEFVGGHDLVAQAVYDGRVDVGAGHDGVIHDLGRRYGYGDAEDRLVRLAKSDPIPSDPVVANLPDNEVDVVKQALVAAGKAVQGAAALKVFWGDVRGLQALDADPYAMLSDALKDLNLAEDDLLR